MATSSKTSRSAPVSEQTCDDTGHDTLPPLLRLPAEMLAAIAEHTDPHSLLALRLACKMVSEAAHGAVIKHHFIHCNRRYTLSSLQKLVKITAQPELVKHIRSISVRGVAVPFIPSAAEALDIEEGEASEVGGLGEKLLVQVFRNLKSAQVLPRITGSWPDYFRSPGPMGDDALVSTPFRSIATADFRVQELLLGTGISGLDSCSMALRFGLEALEKITSSFADITTIQLNLTVRDMLPTNTPFGPFWDLGIILAALTKLQHFSLTCHSSIPRLALGRYHSDQLVALSDMLAAHELVSLDLVHINDPVADWIAFLGHFTDSLETLSLSDVCIGDDECYSVLFRWMAAHMHLHKLTLSLLCRVGVDLTELIQDGDTLECSFVGPSEVKAGLLALAEIVEYVDRTAYYFDDDEERKTEDGGTLRMARTRRTMTTARTTRKSADEDNRGIMTTTTSATMRCSQQLGLLSRELSRASHAHGIGQTLANIEPVIHDKRQVP